MWCPGRITHIHPDKVRVAYQIPGSPADDWFEKELESRSPDLRKAETDRPQEKPAGKQPTWSRAEEVHYREAFNKLLPFSTGKSTLDSDPLAEYLKTSGLPRKVLKQIWIASVTSATEADFDGFGRCCRLVAHCQAALAHNDAATIEVMEQAGEQLRQLLWEKFLDKEVLAKQTAARIELHQAVASKDAAQLKTALEAAAEKLLEIEVPS
eukprot:g33370.t1